MRIFKNKDNFSSSIFGSSEKNHKDKPPVVSSENSWSNFFNKKSEVLESNLLPNAKTVSGRQMPASEDSGSALLNSSKLAGSDLFNKKVSDKTKEDRASEKKDLKNKLSSLDKEYRVRTTDDTLVPKINSVSKCSSLESGTISSPKNSVSIFDNNPFDQIKDREKIAKQPKDKNKSRLTPVKTSEILDKVFISLKGHGKDE
jgi:hypothetical protein